MKRLTSTQLRIVAAVAELDERTVEAAILRRPPSAAVRSAILVALRKQGHAGFAKSLEEKWGAS